VLEYENLSKRLVPEAINFLLNAILRLHPHPYKSKEALPGSFPCLDFTKDESDDLRIARGCGGEIKAPSLLELFSKQHSSSEQDEVDLLALAVDLLCRFSDYYKSLDGFIELYQPVLEVLETMNGNDVYSGQIAVSIHSSLISTLTKTNQQLDSNIQRH
jgi:nucleolar protein 14